MGAAYFIVLDNKQPGFDPFVNGKAIARAHGALFSITDKLGIRSIDELTSFAALDEEFIVPAQHREATTPWFDAREGIAWIAALRQHIESNPSSVEKADRVLSDLAEYE